MTISSFECNLVLHFERRFFCRAEALHYIKKDQNEKVQIWQIKEGEQKGIDVKDAKIILNDIQKFFYNNVKWSQNDAWYIELRDRLARTIVEMQAMVKKKQVEISECMIPIERTEPYTKVVIEKMEYRKYEKLPQVAVLDPNDLLQSDIIEEPKK